MYLLDTHTFIWYLADSPKLSKKARKVISDADNAIYVSAATAWEISTKYRLGKLPEAEILANDVIGYIAKARFSELTVNVRHAQRAGSLPGPHRDPFDRMLMAQSQLEKLTVITLDSVFQDYGIKVLW